MGGLELSHLVFVLSFLCAFVVLFVTIIRLLNKLWWTPIHLQRVMRQQGINGPSYKFFHGNTKDILNMKKQSMTKSMGLSHNTFPRLQPHICFWLNIYGRNILHWHGPQARLMVTELELVKEILNKDQVFVKEDLQGFAKMLLGKGLSTTTGEKWAKKRKLANHTFHAESLKSMTPAMVASVEMMLEGWKQHEGTEIEVFGEFKVLTSEIIAKTAFGSSYLEGKDIFKKLVKLIALLDRNFYKVKLPGLSRFLKSDDEMEAEKLGEEIQDSFWTIIVKREKESSMSGEIGSYGTDFLGSLMRAMNDADEKNRITLQDVLDECKTFYAAGQETTTILLSWVLFLLGIHTDWQERARKEVFNLFGKEKPNPDGISRLKTMSMIINETLRLYPPVITITRRVKGETKLGNYILPADVVVVVPTLPLHHDKQLWGDDVHEFNPERFSQGVVNATNNNPAGYMPFGWGPRNCVGMNFATNEIKIALSMILQRYSFTLSPTYVHSPIQILSVLPENGVQVILHPL